LKHIEELVADNNVEKTFTTGVLQQKKSIEFLVWYFNPMPFQYSLECCQQKSKMNGSTCLHFTIYTRMIKPAIL